MIRLKIFIVFALILMCEKSLVFSQEQMNATMDSQASDDVVANENNNDEVQNFQPPTEDEIKSTIKEYITSESAETATFDVFDPDNGKVRKLTFGALKENVLKTGDYFSVSADFADSETKDAVVLDLDVADLDGDLEVVDVRIHSVNGKDRYTYDENNNRIPAEDEGNVEDAGQDENVEQGVSDQEPVNNATK